MTAPHQDRDQLYQELLLLHDRICKAIGDPKRLMIMYALQAGPRYVVELAEELGYPQPTVSRHLTALFQGGLVKKQRRGTAVYYGLRDPRIITALELLRTISRDGLQEAARMTALPEPGNVSS